MVRNRIHVEARPEQVFAVLSDPDRYPEWVVGARSVRGQEGGFPAAGSRFHHSVGPVGIRDHTEVLEVEPPRRLVLRAKARPLGTARVAIALRESAGGTEVAMEEEPADRMTRLLAGNRLADLALRLRNAAALARLKRLVEGGPRGRPAARREIRGQRVLITGASSGIGLASAERLGREGARLALLARGERGLAAARVRLGGAGIEAHGFSADVRDRAALAAAVEGAAAELGGIDVLVTAAAALSFGPFAETPAEDFDATIDTVLGGTANAIRAALPHLERSGGAVVAIGSTAARMPIPELTAYTTAKHALVGFLEALRVELEEAGSPVSVSLLNPGPVDTPLWNSLESATGLLPPAPPGMYSADSIAAAVAGLIRHPRDELTVGGLARAETALYSLLPGLSRRALRGLARAAQSAGDRPAREGALAAPKGAGRIGGGFGGRGSAAVRTLGAWDGALRAIGR